MGVDVVCELYGVMAARGATGGSLSPPAGLPMLPPALPADGASTTFQFHQFHQKYTGSLR